jgi:hypothetical protein
VWQYLVEVFNKLKTISEGVLLLQNTVTLEQFEDYQRVFYFYQILFPLNKSKIWYSLQLVQVWQYLVDVEYPLIYIVFNLLKDSIWTSWRLYQKVVYFYQILSPFNKLKTISESVLLLPNTVILKQAEDYIKGDSIW